MIGALSHAISIMGVLASLIAVSSDGNVLSVVTVEAWLLLAQTEGLGLVIATALR